MTKKQFTKEEVREYHAGLREKWNEAKWLLESMSELDREQMKKVQEQLPNMSELGYLFCKIQMDTQGLKWFPWIDCKTFNGWKDAGFKIKKGEKSTIYWVTRVAIDKDDIDSYKIPKTYHLFHTSQVEAI